MRLFFMNRLELFSTIKQANIFLTFILMIKVLSIIDLFFIHIARGILARNFDLIHIFNNKLFNRFKLTLNLAVRAVIIILDFSMLSITLFANEIFTFLAIKRLKSIFLAHYANQFFGLI